MHSSALQLLLCIIGWSYQALSAPPGAPEGASALVLIGVTGSGKSETGNTLIGKLNFQVSSSIKSETRDLQAGNTEFNSRRYAIVDTPGFFDSSLSAGDIEAVLAKLSEVAGDRVEALVFVVPYGRFSEPQVRAYRLFRSTFGDEVLRYTVLAFTQCGARTEPDVKKELQELCRDEPDSIVCGITQEVGWDHIVTLGQLDDVRRARDRSSLFKVVENLISKNNGTPYDHLAFARARSHKEGLQRRINAISNEATRRLLEVMLSETKTGGRGLDELHRALEEAEGLGATSWVHVDFEDGTSPFRVVSGGLRQPIPIHYRQLKNFQCTSGGEKLLHTATDSGVKLRNGENRQAVLRSETFKLARGDILWDSAGNGGYVAICRADTSDCLSQRSTTESTVMRRVGFLEDALANFVGAEVYIDVVDDRSKGWGFIAIDNLVYPKILTPSQHALDSDAKTLDGASGTARSLESNSGSTSPSEAAGKSITTTTSTPTAATQPSAGRPLESGVQQLAGQDSAKVASQPPSPPPPQAEVKAPAPPVDDELLPEPAPAPPSHPKHSEGDHGNDNRVHL